MYKFVSISCLAALFVLSHVNNLPAHENASNTDANTCVKHVQDYWAAFSRMDADAAIALHSAKGVYATNSDGSFHKPVKITSVEEMKKNFLTYSGLWTVYYPEAISLSNDVILTRYYLEGLSKAGASKRPTGLACRTSG